MAYHRSVEELCMLYKIRCNSMHPLYDPLPVLYVPVLVISGALVVRLLDAEPCSTAGLVITSQCLVERSVRLKIDGVGLQHLRAGPMIFLLLLLLAPFLYSTVLFSLLSFYG